MTLAQCMLLGSWIGKGIWYFSLFTFSTVVILVFFTALSLGYFFTRKFIYDKFCV